MKYNYTFFLRKNPGVDQEICSVDTPASLPHLAVGQKVLIGPDDVSLGFYMVREIVTVTYPGADAIGASVMVDEALK